MSKSSCKLLQSLIIILSGLKKGLELGKIHTLHFTNLNTSRLGMQSIGLGMAGSITLKRISLHLMNFSPELISDLTPGIINCAPLQVLDFSYNSMND